jgi:hypothetical protein
MGYWADQEMVREALVSADRIDDNGYFKGNRRYETEVDAARMGIRDNRNAMNKAPAGRNPRSVLTPKPESYSGPHYAAYPTSLIAPLIRATCPSRCCPVCGAGWSPVVEKTITNRVDGGTGLVDDRNDGGKACNADRIYNIHGYRPTCSCGREDWRPGIVLDPFLGSGTTLQVARELMVSGVGLDLAHTYLDEQAKVRARVGAPAGALDDLPLFNLGIEKETT